MKNIKSRLFVHKQIFSIPYRLIIEGYEGHGKRDYGGQYAFVATYLSSEEHEGRNGSTLDNWCKQNNIPFIHSQTFEGLVQQLETFDRPELKELHQF